MKLLLLFAAILALALAAPAPQQNPLNDARIEEYNNENDGLGTYNFGFKTSNGIVRQENAVLKNAGTENEALEVRGTIKWIDSDNKEQSINFLANENGYQLVP